MSGHLDMALIGELKELMEDDFGELLQTYLADSELRLAQIRAAINAQSAAELRTSAHGLKGASSNIGAETLAGLCQHLEELGREQRCAEAPAHLPVLERELSAVQTALRLLL